MPHTKTKRAQSANANMSISEQNAVSTNEMKMWRCFICISAVHILQSMPKTKESMPETKVSFLPRVKMNSINWYALNIWVYVAQLAEQCCAKADYMGSNLVEAPKVFSVFIGNCLNCDYNCDGRIFLSFVFQQFTWFILSSQYYSKTGSVRTQDVFNANAKRVR